MQQPQISEIWQYDYKNKYLIVMIMDNAMNDPLKETYPWVADIIAIDGDKRGTLYQGYTWPNNDSLWRKIE